MPSEKQIEEELRRTAEDFRRQNNATRKQEERNWRTTPQEKR
jgi:hypothetical protein